MLLNIFSESQGLEGLLSGNELQSLLIATTCLREHSCCFWKEPTFCVLRAISKAQNLSIIQYLQGKSPGTRGWLWAHFPQQDPVMLLQHQDRFLGPKKRWANKVFIYAQLGPVADPISLGSSLDSAFVAHFDAPLEEGGKGGSFTAHMLSDRNRAWPICMLSHLLL